MSPQVSSETPPPTMEIDHGNFWRELPAVLEAICTAEYITYDLEMTGIMGEAIQSVPERPLEDAYQMARSAAQTFQILQMGITCFSYSTGLQKYTSRTYSIHLTPFFSKYSDDLARLIDRKVTFSYKTFLFLERHDFSFEKAFARGVPYLSRAEELKATEKYLTHHLEKEYSQRNPDTLDPLTRTACDRARAQITSWLDSYPNSGHYVVIKNLSQATQQVRRGLNDALRQLVKSEFPDCYINFPQGEATVYKWDPEQRRKWNEDSKTRQEVVARQTAFRHIFEALVGGRFAGKIDVDMLFPSGHEPSVTDRIGMRKKLQRCENKRRERPPILVGHNQYLDLCFMYQTFVGDLPPTFAEFRACAKNLWPRLIDTKHMAMTLGFGNQLNLVRLHKILSETKDSFALKYEIASSMNLLCLDDDKETAAAGAAHDAGYDSWMTAVVFGNLVKKALRKQGASKQQSVASSESTKDMRSADPFSLLCPFASKAGTTLETTTTQNGLGKQSQRDTNHANGIAGGLGSDLGRFIPRWDVEDGGREEIWKQHGGKVRIGAAGVLDLA